MNQDEMRRMRENLANILFGSGHILKFLSPYIDEEKPQVQKRSSVIEDYLKRKGVSDD